MTERAFVLDCQGERLLAILAPPPAAAPRSQTGVVVVVGGPQTRVGSHRQFVQLARAVAAGGHACLRFDVRGMGDSTGAQRSFEAIGEDIACAIEGLLREAPGVRRVVLVGLCDGASAALMYANGRHDPRVGGLCLLNPWVRSEASLERTHAKHYYLQRLRQGSFWRKLLAGGVGLQALGAFARALRRLVRPAAAEAGPSGQDFRSSMLAGLGRFEAPVLIALSGNDLTAQEFADTLRSQPAWHAAAARPNVTRLDMPGADHTLSVGDDRRGFESRLLAWLDGLGARAATLETAGVA
jgi:uncharacterized protein